MIASLMTTLAYILSSVFMVIITYNKQTSYNLLCGLTAFAEHFFLLSYFVWLMITIIMNYFTIKFQLDNFTKFFRPLVAISLRKCSKSIAV